MWRRRAEPSSYTRKKRRRVREIFQLYLKLGSLIPVIEELDRRGWTMKRWTTREGRTRGGAPFNKTTLHNLLTNVVYTGHVKFEGKVCAGEHERIVNDDIFNRVQAQLNRNGRRGGRNVANKYGGLLKGLVKCGSCGVGDDSHLRAGRSRRYTVITFASTLTSAVGAAATRNRFRRHCSKARSSKTSAALHNSPKFCPVCCGGLRKSAANRARRR